jgi:hypothetical protein
VYGGCPVRRIALFLVTALVLGAFVSGCGGGDEVEAPAPPATPPAATEPPEATATATEDGDPIVFVLSGGDGRWEELVLNTDGAARGTYLGDGSDLGTLQLSSEEVAELQGLLDGSGLFTEDQLFEGDIVDDFRYEVTYRGVTVTADSSAAPESLLPATSRLHDLVDSLVFGDG